MQNQKTKKNKILKLSFLFLILIIFSAFGCKQAEEASDVTAETSELSASEVPFTPPEPSATSGIVGDTTVSITDPTETIQPETFLAPTTEDTAISGSPADNPATDDGAETSLDIESPAVNEAPKPDVTSSLATDEEEVIKLSKVLAEIYGTFTNKDLEPFKNLKDLKTYASDGMNKWIESKITGSQPSGAAPFYGITTKALSAGVLNSGRTEYKILVTCEREEIKEAEKSPNKYYQLIEMNFIKSGDKWLLDSAYWK